LTSNKNYIILGIDPGTVVMGCAVMECVDKKISMLYMDVLKQTAKSDAYEKLQFIYQKIITIVNEYKPTEMAIEAPFFGKNVQSMLKLGRAQGVAIAAAMQNNLVVTEYSPKKVKQAVTGNGNATKEQVWTMLQRQLDLPDQPKYFDASDALAVAVCHYYESQSPLVGVKKKNDWGSFIARNAHRVKAPVNFPKGEKK